MRLWHEQLIPQLPDQQLLGQHRECCALRGNGWGRKHSAVDYVFRHSYYWLVAYHRKIIMEMADRGYQADPSWISALYRGKNKPSIPWVVFVRDYSDFKESLLREPIYPEHDATYLRECLENLARKGIKIDMEE